MTDIIASWRNARRRSLDERNRRRLKNHAPSVIANNCNGGVLCHDLGLRFNSPTVNLFIPFPDYVRFCKELRHYLSLPAEAMTEADLSSEYPTGYLEDLPLHFVHYSAFEEAKDKWFERAARVDFGTFISCSRSAMVVRRKMCGLSTHCPMATRWHSSTAQCLMCNAPSMTHRMSRRAAALRFSLRINQSYRIVE